MRYVISDIHGEYSLFVELMQKIGFSENDELYICGDIIKKGDDSVKLLKLISEMPNVHAIRGNHEEAFLNCYYALMREQDDYDFVLENLRDYIQGDGKLLTWELVEFIESLPYYIETDDFICVHAGVPLDDNRIVPMLEKVPIEELLYNRKFKSPDVLPQNSKCVFYGHTSSMSVFGDARIVEFYRTEEKPNNIKDYIKVHMDTGVFTSGVLACFCIDTCTSHFVTKRKLLEPNNKLKENKKCTTHRILKTLEIEKTKSTLVLET